MDPARLKRTLADLWRNSSSRFGYQITYSRPDGGWMIQSAAGRVFNISSAAKPLLLAAVLRQVENGALGLQEELVMHKRDRVATSRLADTLPDGSAVSVAWLCAAMIEENDNTATEMLLRAVGKAALDALLAAAGLRQTRLPVSLRRLIAHMYGMEGELDEQETLSGQISGLAPIPQRVEEVFIGPLSICSSPAELVRFYEFALSGQCFRQPETLAEFKRFMRLEDAAQNTAWPPGWLCYRKGSQLELPPFYSATQAGCAVSAGERYTFAFRLNCQSVRLELLEAELETFRNSIRAAFTAFREGTIG